MIDSCNISWQLDAGSPGVRTELLGLIILGWVGLSVGWAYYISGPTPPSLILKIAPPYIALAVLILTKLAHAWSPMYSLEGTTDLSMFVSSVSMAFLMVFTAASAKQFWVLAAPP